MYIAVLVIYSFCHILDEVETSSDYHQEHYRSEHVKSYAEKSDTAINPTSVINMDTAQPSVFSQECIGVGIEHDASFGKDDEFNGSMTKVSTFPESSLSGRESDDPQFKSSCKADHCKEFYCAATMAGECAGIGNHENLPYGGDDLRVNKEEIAISAPVVARNEYSQNQHVCITSVDGHGCQLVQSIPDQDITSSCRRVHSEPKKGGLNIHFTKVAMLPSVGVLMGEVFTDKYATDTQGSKSGEVLLNAVTMSGKVEVLFEMATCRERRILYEESSFDLEKENSIEEDVFTGALIETPQVHASLKHQCTSISSSVLTDENESRLSHCIPEEDKNLPSCQQSPNGNLDRVQMDLEFSESLGDKLLPSAGILMTQAPTDVSRNPNERSKPSQFIPKVTCTSTLHQLPLYSGFLSRSLDMQNPMLNSEMCVLESTGILMSGLSICENVCEQQPFTITASEQAVGNSIVTQANANFEFNEAPTCNFAQTCQKEDTCEANAGEVALTNTKSLTPALPNAFHSFQHKAIESYPTNDCTPGHFLNTDVHNMRSECSTKFRRRQGDSENCVSGIQKLSMGEIVNSAGVLMINPYARASPEQSLSLSITSKNAYQIPMNRTATEERILQSTGILMATDIQSIHENKIKEHFTGTCTCNNGYCVHVCACI